MYKFGKNSLKNREGIDQGLIEVSDLAIQITPIDFGIPADGGIRTPERQHELFLAGKSKCDGYEKISRHQIGEALDFYAYVDGVATWDPKYLAMVATAFLQASIKLNYPIEWGGLWPKFKDEGGIKHGWDMPHIQKMRR